MTDGKLAPAGEPERVVLPDPEAVSEAAAERIASTLAEAVAARGRADWATTGGSAPVGIYRLLSAGPLRDRVPWDGVHLWWGDDRYVPRDDPLSNVRPADEVLLPGVPIPASQVHPMPVGEAVAGQLGPAWAAERYEKELRGSGIEATGGWPVFDLVLLGIGPDGHLLSVFPGSAAFDDDDQWALAIPAPSHVEPHVARVTLNPRVLEAARHVLVVTHGGAKAEVLGRVFGPERDPRRWPAQLARRPGVTWLLDGAAAGAPAPTTSGGSG